MDSANQVEESSSVLPNHRSSSEALRWAGTELVQSHLSESQRRLSLPVEFDALETPQKTQRVNSDPGS